MGLFGNLEKLLSFSKTSTMPNHSSVNKYKGAEQDSISEWDKKWKCIGPLKSANLTPYNHCVGLYRHVINGETMYVGRAIELHNGGFRKRLSDYRRESNSGRTHTSGRLIYENLSKIVTYILVVGDKEEDIQTTKELEKLFVKKYNPKWNVQLK